MNMSYICSMNTFDSVCFMLSKTRLFFYIDAKIGMIVIETKMKLQ